MIEESVSSSASEAAPQRVVVVGGGFGGLQTVRKLRGAAVDITLVDRQNFHLFQPLVYQVATGALAAAEVAAPLRSVLRRQENARVVLAQVGGFDLERRQVVLDHLPNGQREQRLDYDTLVVGGGSRYSYFGHDDWRPHAHEPKSLSGALDIRNRIFTAFEAAEVESDDERKQARDPSRDHALQLGQQPVAPIQRGPQRLVPRHRRAGATGEEPEAIVQPGSDLLGAQGPDPGGDRTGLR